MLLGKREISDDTFREYCNHVPEYTEESVRDALDAILNDPTNVHRYLDLITFDYYIRPEELGGLGYGVLKTQDDPELPPHLTRELPPLRPARNMPQSRRIAQLLRLHPDLDADYANLDLRRLNTQQTIELLQTIEQRLGIKS